MGQARSTGKSEGGGGGGGRPAVPAGGPAVVPLPDGISADLKKQADVAMSKIRKLKKKKKSVKKKPKAITHDKTKMSQDLFGAGIDTPDWPTVKEFLKKYRKTMLSPLLIEASIALRTIFGEEAKLVLEVLKSPVRRSRRSCLYMVIKSGLQDEEEDRAYDRFVDTWWSSREARAAGLLTIGLASDDNIPVINVFDETKGECLSGFKVCHVEWCRFHLHSDVHSSSIAFQKHGDETCILRLAKKSNHTLEEIGEMFGCTRERIRQIETVATGKVGYDLIKCGVISLSDLTKEVANRLKASRKHKPFTIEDDHFRRRGPGRPRKLDDEDEEGRVDDEGEEGEEE